MKRDTLAIHTPYQSPDPYGALSMPVYHCAAYEFADAETMSQAFVGKVQRPDYSRILNPTVSHFENRVKALTGAKDVVAFSSGMAAITGALMSIASQGKNIVTSRHLFGNTYSFVAGTLLRFGVKPKLVDMTDVESVAAAIDSDTCCVYLEIVTNPQMEVADLAAIAQVAHQRGTVLVADTTVIPFTHFSARALGVDVELVSSTKYVSGGATSLGGLLIDYGTLPWLRDRVRNETLVNLGAVMTPHAAYMQTVGLETLSARYERQAANAMWVAAKLQDASVNAAELQDSRFKIQDSSSKVNNLKPESLSVNYPGLPSNPFHDIAEKLFGGTYGAMLTIDLPSREACFRFLDNLRLVKRATNLFDNRTLAIHPASTIFGFFTPRQLQKMDVLDTTIRLSIGLEDKEDILADLLQAIEKGLD